jgi:acetyl esterase
MPPHPRVASFLELAAAAGVPPVETQDPATARAERALLVVPSKIELPVVRDVDAGGVPARLYRPVDDERSTGLVVWYHGGGWVLGSVDGHDDVCRDLCARSGHSVLSVEYRLAPEHPFPAGLDDAVTAIRWAHEHAVELGVDRARLAVGGDSAGGNLAAVVAQLRAVPLAFQLLVYPITDARASSDSYRDNADGYFLTASGMRWFIGHYLSGGAGSPDDPRVSPLLADDATIAATPPALVITAEFDPLRDEGVAYVDRLVANGVHASHVHFNGQIHAFFSLPEYLDDATLARALAAEAIRTALA